MSKNQAESSTTSHPHLAKFNPADIKTALQVASMNVLRLALYHQTQDPELASIPVVEKQLRGGALKAHVVPREYYETIRKKAFEFLSSESTIRPHPTREQAAELMSLFAGGETLSSAAQNYGFEELGFADHPRDTQWNKRPTKQTLDEFKVVIIGSGFSGMAAAVQLDRLGIKYKIIERHPEVGGTWHINDYPEARVDVPSFSYQYKFEKNYPWKSFFATCDELREYADHIADKYNIRKHILFNTQLTNAKWDETTQQWQLSCNDADGEELNIDCNVVISASGLFSTANLPDIDGIERFEGKMFHTTEWDHSYDYSGKKVALIGTGSTGTQLARALADKAEKLTVFQRTANWVTPVNGYHAQVPDETRWLNDNMPGYLNWFIYANSVSELNLQEMHDLDPEWIARGGQVSAQNQQLRETLTEFVREKVSGDPAMMEKLIPDHSPLARRLVIDNQWYETLMRDNVELITDGILEITKTGIIDSNGVEHQTDLIVLGAGFKVSQYLWPANYQGHNGVTVKSLWDKDGARAFKGMTMPGFPNFFMMYGPNSQARAGSFHSVVEVLSRYISGLIAHMLEADKQSMEVTEQAYTEYNSALDEANKNLLWEDEQGGGGYYVNEHGRSGVNMPWRLHEFYTMVQKPDVENYRFS